MVESMSDEARAQLSALYERERLLLVEAYGIALRESYRIDGPLRIHTDDFLRSQLAHLQDDAESFKATQLQFLCEVIEGYGVVPAQPAQTFIEKLRLCWGNVRMIFAQS